MTREEKKQIDQMIATLVKQAYAEAEEDCAAGPWCYDMDKAPPTWEERFDSRDSEMIALMHSELSEVLEAMRYGNPPDDKISGYGSVESELADVVIRIMDYAEASGINVAEAIEAKIKFNKARPYRHGGKVF